MEKNKRRNSRRDTNRREFKKYFWIDCYIGKNPINNKIQISYMTNHYHIDGVGIDHFHEDKFTGIHSHIIK